MSDDYRIIQLRERYRLGRWAVAAAGAVASVAALRIPLEALQPMVDAFAGKQTDVRFLITVSFAVTVAISIALAFTVSYTIAQRKELQRQRERMTWLERQLERMLPDGEQPDGPAE
jgi:hypothetical protein